MGSTKLFCGSGSWESFERLASGLVHQELESNCIAHGQTTIDKQLLTDEREDVGSKRFLSKVVFVQGCIIDTKMFFSILKVTLQFGGRVGWRGSWDLL